jgi:xanthosine utilization system XapX-like protein
MTETPPTISALVLLGVCVGGLIVHAIHQRAHIARLESDILDLWSEVFGTEEDEPDPGDVADEPEDGKVVELRARAA